MIGIYNKNKEIKDVKNITHESLRNFKETKLKISPKSDTKESIIIEKEKEKDKNPSKKKLL